MLIEFSIENFRSIKERVTLSMIAARLRSSDSQLDRDNVTEINGRLALLRSALIYGANASGKSNIIKAMSFMRRFVTQSASVGQEEDVIPVEPFSLNQTTLQQPSTFEAVFLLDGIQYRYGFSVNVERVVAEWLYCVPTSREAELFTRDENEIHIGERFREGHGLEKRTRNNALFLSVVAQFNGEIAKRVRRWFVTTCRTLTAINDTGYLPYTVKCINEGKYRQQIEGIVRRLDLDITGLSVSEVPLNETALQIVNALKTAQNAENDKDEESLNNKQDRTMMELRTRHAVRDDNGSVLNDMEFSARKMESEGTQKLIALAGPLLDVLTNGWVLFVDEIDSRLHPLITAALLRLFNSPTTNPKNAQLVCATHDTNLLDRRFIRRDQIFFVEKDRTAATHLYSLAEFKLESSEGSTIAVRNDASLEKNYIQGRYGAIPYLGDLNQFFIEELLNNELTEEFPDTPHEATK